MGVGYLRVSTERQGESGLGLAAQRQAIESWAQREGVTIESWYEDHVSGTTPLDLRPGLMAALERIPPAGLLIVAKRDRLARDVGVVAVIESRLGRMGARVVSAAGEGNDDTIEAELMRGVIDVFARFERARIAQRITGALAAKRARGEPTGNAPYGQRWQDGALVDDPGERAVMARIVELRKAKHSLREIAARLNSEALRPRRGAWSATTVQRIVARYRLVGGVVVEIRNRDTLRALTKKK